MTLSSAFDISVAGLTAHSERMKLHANNIANVNTPGYIRKIPVLAENTYTNFEDVLTQMRSGVISTGISYGPSGVTMAGVALDPTPGKKVYQPGHPEADKNGYVTLSNVDVMSDMADAMGVSRLYEANLAVVGIVKNMANKALEIGRGS